MVSSTIDQTTSFLCLKLSNGFPHCPENTALKALKDLIPFKSSNVNLLPLFPSVTVEQLPRPSFCSLNMPNLFLPQGLCTCSFCLECCLHYLHIAGSFLSFRPQVKYLILRESFPTIIICDGLCPPPLVKLGCFIFCSTFITIRSCLLYYLFIVCLYYKAPHRRESCLSYLLLDFQQ